MPVQILMPREEKDAVERLSGLLSLVGGVKKTFFEGPTDEEKELSALQRRKAKIDADMAEDQKMGIATGEKKLQYAKDYDFSEKPAAGSIAFQFREGDQVKTIYGRPKEKMDPLAGLNLAIKNLEKQKLEKEVKEGPAPKENQSKSAGFATRASDANKIIEQLASVPNDENVLGIPTYEIQNLPIFPNRAKSQNVKQFDQAASDFVSAVLRKESGANIPDDELAKEKAKYLPQPGDSEAVLKQKAASRANALAALEAEAGENALQRVRQAKPTPDVPENVRSAAMAELARRKGLNSAVRTK